MSDVRAPRVFDSELSSCALYSREAGWGWEPGAAPGGPLLFSVAVPEGNWDVHMSAAGSTAAVRAETRRLMWEAAPSRSAQRLSCSFTVNVRNARLTPPPENAPGGSMVVLNDREHGSFTWDDKLTLELLGRAPRLSTLEISPAPDAVTVFLAGDSTVADQPRSPYASWGQMLPRFFRRGIAVANHAQSGETLKSFISGLRLAKTLEKMKAGDWLFIQFGHNDQKEQWPQTYADATTTYTAYLRVFIQEARLRGANPVLLTSVQRRTFGPDGKIANSHGRYPDAVRALAEAEAVPLIDMHRMSTRFYEALGPGEAPRAFADDGRDATHHNAYGAYQLAKCVVQEIRRQGLSLAEGIAADFQGYDPSHPDPVVPFLDDADQEKAPGGQAPAGN